MPEKKYKTFITSLQSCYDVVNKNRSELAPQTGAMAQQVQLPDEDEFDDLSMEEGEE